MQVGSSLEVVSGPGGGGKPRCLFASHSPWFLCGHTSCLSLPRAESLSRADRSLRDIPSMGAVVLAGQPDTSSLFPLSAALH